jgi:hypothetical protein
MGRLDASFSDGIDPGDPAGLAWEIDAHAAIPPGFDIGRPRRVEPEATSDEGSAGDVSLAEAGLTVLVVDDEPLVVQIVSQELDDAGCVVESASGTEEAVDRLSFLSRA